MNITCPKCGAFNRAGARYCAVCGYPLPAPAAPPQPQQRALQPGLHQPGPKPPGPQQPVATLLPPNSSPQFQPPPAAPQKVIMPRSGLFRRGPVVEGRVNVVDPERQEKAPFDPARSMVMLSIVGVIAGFLLGFVAAGMAIGIVLLILGVGIGLLGCLASLVLLPLKMILSPIINFIRGDPTVTVLNFQVLDVVTGAPVDVLLYRKPGGGNVRLGDVVRIQGSMQRSCNVVRARRVQVTESGGRATNYKVDALRPWPIWIGLLIMGLAVVSTLQLAGVINLR
jgi:hypothetical protein